MYNKFLIEQNNKYFRLDIKMMSLDDLYKVLTDSSISCCFIVFKRDNYLERFKIEKPLNLDSFLEKIEYMLYVREDNGIDSDCFNIYDASFLDCYPI